MRPFPSNAHNPFDTFLRSFPVEYGEVTDLLRRNCCSGFWPLLSKKIRMYYGSGAVDRIASRQSADATVAGAASGHCLCTHQMAALFYDKLLIAIFTWRTILPNFIPIRFERTEP